MEIKVITEENFNKYGIRNSTWTSIAPTGCVKGDTLVLTDEGLLNIFEIYRFACFTA